MKTFLLKFCIFILLFFSTITICQTTVEIPGVDRWIRLISGSGFSNGYNELMVGGSGNSRWRSYITWDNIRSYVPANVEIAKAEFIISWDDSDGPIEYYDFNNYTGNIPTDWANMISGDLLGSLSASVTTYSFPELASRVQVIINGTGSNVIRLAIKMNNEEINYNHYYYNVSLRVTWTNVTVTQLDKNSNTFGQVGRWLNNTWNNQNVPFSFESTSSTGIGLRSYQEFKAGTNEKYQGWTANTDKITVNPYNFTVQMGANLLTAKFNQSYSGITIKNSLVETSVTGGTLFFSDPWLIDYPSQFTNTNRNQGMEAPFKSRTSPFYPDFSTSYNGDIHKGVFLDQLISSGTHYRVWAGDQQINLGGSLGTRNFYFQNWTSTGASLQPYGSGNEAWVVFTSSSAVVQANLKGQGLSNNPNAYTNNSQRKFVKSPNGDLHYVYTSMGHVWYERSTDAGNTWTLANDGNYLDNGEGKLPSIDENGDATHGDGTVLIVFQEKNGNNYQIKLKKFNYGALNSEAVVYSVNQSYTIDANPVVAYSNNTTSNDKFIVAFQTSQGLYYRYGYIYTGLITWPLIEPAPEGILNGTNQYSINPTIAAGKNTGGQGDFHLAWQQNNEIYYKKIHYVGDEITDDPTPVNISSNTGFSEHYNPSIIEMPGSSARICWVGFRMVYPEKDIEVDAFPQYKVLFKSPQNPGSFWQFGNNVSSPNINKQNDNTITLLDGARVLVL